MTLRLLVNIDVPDLDRGVGFNRDGLGFALRRAIAAGARVERPAADAAFGRIATLRDPFCHGFCLIELADGGYDNVSG